MAAKLENPPRRKESWEVGRREFLSIAGSGLTLSFLCELTPRAADATAGIAGPPPNTQVATWLNIGNTGQVTLTIGSSEMGQGSFSGLAQILAEDLMVDYNSIQTVQGKPSVGAPQVGNSLGTFGSTIIRNNYWTMRTAGAAAREMLVQAAMNLIGDQNRASYTVANSVITYAPSNTQIAYALVAAAAANLAVPPNPPLIPDSQFRLIGTTVNRVDIPSKVNGSAVYGIDVRLPNMVFAVIAHCPTFGGYLNGAVPPTPAGMIAVVPTQVVAGVGRGTETTGMVNAVAVVGPNTWDTWQAALNLKVNWTIPASSSSLNDQTFINQANAALTSATPWVQGGANNPPTLYQVEGNFAAAQSAIAGAAKSLTSTYTLPYIAHNMLEPMNCTVNYVPGVSCDVYAPTQVASSVLSIANQLTGLPLSQINVHTTYLGGALGRRIETDFISQAIQVAMAVGKPIQLLWPREQNFLRDQYRPLALIQVGGGLDGGGNVVGWNYTGVSPTILGQRGAPLGASGDSQATEGSTALPYRFESLSTRYITHPSPIPVGFWRSVGMSLNTFAVECMIDELAAQAGADPYTFRLGLLTDPRWIAVLQAVANLSNWQAGAAAGHGLGMAITTYANSITATVVDVSLKAGNDYDGQPALLKLNNVWMALDCYLSVNPGQLEAQLTGGMVHGLNAVLYGRQSFVKGAAQFPNFYQNRVIRMDEMPQVAVTIIPSPQQSSQSAPIGGAGEIGVPCIAPALANAYFRAGGKRIRTLPFFPNAWMGGINNSGI